MSLLSRIFDLSKKKPAPAPAKEAPAAVSVWDFAVIVTDESGRGIDGATVTIEGCPTGPLKTNRDGYVYQNTLPGIYAGGAIMVVADGFTVSLAKYQWADLSHKNLTITLRSDWPAAPSRDEVLSARVGFQGVTVQTQQFGAIRAWGPELGSLNDQDADSYVQQVMADGFSAVEFAVSWNYSSPSFRYPVPGSDLSQNLPELKRRIKRAIQVGAPLGLRAVYLFCAGDGESNPAGGYNDPGGWTYGRAWLMGNFRRIYESLGPTEDDPTDLRDWIVFLPGYDACDAYQWTSGDHVVDWWHLQRSILDRGGKGYAGYEWCAGQCQLGDGFPTYTPENAGCVDLWLLELPPGLYPPASDDDKNKLTQQIGRLCRPYNRPPWAIGDEHPPFYLAQVINTRRGKQYVQIYEFNTYDWVRGCPVELIDNNRRLLRVIAPETIIC